MKKLLVIDDNEQFVTLIKEYFVDEYLVYSCTKFNNVDDIILKVKEIFPDIILLDINLGKTTGIEVVKNIERLSLSKKIPVIVLTASDYNTITERILKEYQSVCAFYSKLHPLELIKEKIENILSSNPKE